LRKIDPKMVVIIGVIFVSFSSVLIKMSDAPSLIIAAYRIGITVLFIIPTVVTRNSKEIRSVDKKTLLLCMVSGVFLALHFATWISSIKYTSIASSTVLVNTHPIFIVIGTYLVFKEKISKMALLSIVITLLGSLIVSSVDSSLGSNVIYGDILAILGGLFVSGYMIIGGIARKKISVTAYTFIVYLSCAITLFSLNIAVGTPLSPYPLKEWIIFICLALFCTILGHSIFNWALGYVKPTFLSTSVLGEPVFATLWAMLLFKEIPNVWNIIGSIIIFCGIYMYIRVEGDTQKIIVIDQI
jgi:drug/metabolite transporter (DMT)-like permease